MVLYIRDQFLEGTILSPTDKFIPFRWLALLTINKLMLLSAERRPRSLSLQPRPSLRGQVKLLLRKSSLGAGREDWH